MPGMLRKRLDEGRAVYDLGSEEAEGDRRDGTPGGDGLAAVHRTLMATLDDAGSSRSARLPRSIHRRGPQEDRGHDPLDDLAPDEFGVYLDDVSGEELPPDLTHAARVEELRFMKSWHVWDVRPVSECKAVTGKAPIGGRWVDHNKGRPQPPGPQQVGGQ